MLNAVTDDGRPRLPVPASFQSSLHTAAYSRPESRRGFRGRVSWRRARAAPLILARLRCRFRGFGSEGGLARVDEVMRRGSTSASLHYLLPLQLPYPGGGTPHPPAPRVSMATCERDGAVPPPAPQGPLPVKSQISPRASFSKKLGIVSNQKLSGLFKSVAGGSVRALNGYRTGADFSRKLKWWELCCHLVVELRHSKEKSQQSGRDGNNVLTNISWF